MNPLQSNRYWQRADAPGRAEVLAALGALKVGERLSLADVTRSVQIPALADGNEEGEGQREASATAPDLVEYTSGALRADQIDGESREVEVAFSSEEPYERWWGIEILGHAPGECDLSWMSSGRAPVLCGHDTQIQIGVIRSVFIGRDRIGRSTWQFGKSAKAEEEMRDAKDGVRVNVSVGYEILELELVKQEGDVRTYRVTRWRPLEQSLVSIPADMTVGLGRSVDALPPPSQTTAPATPAHKEQRTVDTTQIAEQAVRDERARQTQIMDLATRHNMREFGEKACREGTSIELFRGLMLDELHKKGSDKPLEQPATQLGLTQKQAQSFSVTRWMHSLIEGKRELAPFESECVETLRNKLAKDGIKGQRAGNFLPYDVLAQPLPGVRVEGGHLMVGDRVIAAQRDLATSTTAAGGALVATDLMAADFITLLRAASLVRRMGARVLSGLVGNVAIPRQIGGVTPSWVAQGGPGAESDASFATVTLAMKTAHAIQDVTRDMLMQATPAIEGIIRADMIEAMAAQLDWVSLNGAGSGNQPLGLFNTPGLGAVVGGANGAAPVWDHWVELESQVANNNAAQGAMGYITNTRVRGKSKRTQKFTGTNGQEIWMPAMAGDDPSVFGSVNGYRAGVSNNVRFDLTKGTSAGVCSAIGFGNWSDLLIGEWGTAEILPDQLTQAANRIVRFHIWQSVDVAVRRAQSFSAMLDALHA